MRVLKVRNVNDAYREGVSLLRQGGVLEHSRAGDVMVFPEPVATVYARPDERVLFDPDRAANPFFHLLEAAWMLAGRRDATWLDEFVRDFSSRFAEEDGNAHGAYGFRWRGHFDLSGGSESAMDQIVIGGRMLYDDPTTRRVVTAMWDPMSDLDADKRDIPCNTQIMWRSRRDHQDDVWLLDMTVCCRSNDIVWGAYGANAVHMSVLHEVMAGLAGMRLGTYTQVSNNWHAYTSILGRLRPTQEMDPYRVGTMKAQSLLPIRDSRDVQADDARLLIEDVEAFVENPFPAGRIPKTESWWVGEVLRPMLHCFRLHREKRTDQAIEELSLVGARDWREAGRAWLLARSRPADTRSA